MADKSLASMSLSIHAAGLLLKTCKHADPAEQPKVFRAAARALMQVSADVPDAFIVNVGTLFVAGENTKIPREAILDIVEEEAKAAGIRIVGVPSAPTPDTAPDTVVTSSPPPPGVDLADGPDSTSVVVIDNEVS